MTTTHRLKCDGPECGETLVYGETPDKEGWLEVWDTDDTVLDFCSQDCLTSYYNTDDDEEEV